VKAGALLRLAALSLRAERKGALLNGAAACAGAAALVFFVALGLGVGDAARALFPGEARLVEVVPSSVALGAVLGGGQLDDDALARLAALPGAEAAWPKLSLRVPIAASRAPAGLNVNWPPSLTLQIPGVGVPRALLGADLSAGAPFEDGGEAAPIPVVLSRRLVEVYNRTIAPAWNVRRLPPAAALVGLEVPVRVGWSMVPLKTEDRVYDARLLLAAFSDRVPVYAAALPLETVRRLHREYGKKDAGYSAVALLARRPDDVPALAAAARRMGFAVDEGERATAERVGTAVAVTTGALALLALLMCALAALAIAQSLLASARARAKDLAVLQAVGATAADVRALLVAEAALTGLAGGLAGTAIARALALAADAAARRALPDFPFKPETLFAFPPWLYTLGVAVAVVAATLGALAPASAAARADPARSLS
jgi:putative ABC transport system permease protein